VRKAVSVELPPVIVICGPTATGKSAQALFLAEQLGSLLISADSRQIYRELDIGTAKPTPELQARWPHHLIDIADPTERWTVAQYQALAQGLIQQAHQQGRIPILVGGTGLYLQAATGGLGIPTVPPQLLLRQQLESWPLSVQHSFLQQVDPVAAVKIHPHDQVRILRALEVYYVTGQPTSAQQQRRDPSFRVLTLGLTCEMDRLEKRIAQRTDQMLEAGWIPEVERLRQRYGAHLPLLQTLGYEEIGLYLDGQLSQRELAPLIARRTRQFAKRQMTWFRKTPDLHWLNCEDRDLTQQIEAHVKDFLARSPLDPSPASSPR